VISQRNSSASMAIVVYLTLLNVMRAKVKTPLGKSRTSPTRKTLIVVQYRRERSKRNDGQRGGPLTP